MRLNYITASVMTLVAKLHEAGEGTDKVAGDLLSLVRDFRNASTKVALSPLQEDYQKYFREKMEKHELTSISGGTPDQLAEFFTDVSDGWAKGTGRKKSNVTASRLRSRSTPPGTEPLTSREDMKWDEFGYEEASRLYSSGELGARVELDWQFALSLDKERIRSVNELDDPQFWEKFEAYKNGFTSYVKNNDVDTRLV